MSAPQAEGYKPPIDQVQPTFTDEVEEKAKKDLTEKVAGSVQEALQNPYKTEDVLPAEQRIPKIEVVAPVQKEPEKKLTLPIVPEIQKKPLIKRIVTNVVNFIKRLFEPFKRDVGHVLKDNNALAGDGGVYTTDSLYKIELKKAEKKVKEGGDLVITK